MAFFVSQMRKLCSSQKPETHCISVLRKGTHRDFIFVVAGGEWFAATASRPESCVQANSLDKNKDALFTMFNDLRILAVFFVVCCCFFLLAKARCKTIEPIFKAIPVSSTFSREARKQTARTEPHSRYRAKWKQL